MKDLHFLSFIYKRSRNIFYRGANYNGVKVGLYINKKDDSQVVITLETVGEVIVGTQMTLIEFHVLRDTYEKDDALASYFYRYFNCESNFN